MSRQSTALPAPPAEAGQRLFEMALGGLVTQMLYVVAKLGIADMLKHGPQTCETLARATGTHAPSLQRVMRALASLGIFTETAPGEFGLTPLAACMRTDAPGAFRNLPIYLGGELYRAFGELLEGVKTGEPVFDRLFGLSYFEYLGQNDEAAQVFNAAMTALGAMAETAAVTAAYDFSTIGTVVDVGGGHGSLLASILQAYPSVRGVLFDQPAVIESAQSQVDAAAVAERCQLVSGDFFTAVPTGGDVYLLKRIIHDWDDERCIAILRNCRRAMAPRGRLVVVETVLPPGDTPSVGKLVDVVMMTLLLGRERTAAEYGALFQASGFDLAAITPTESPMSLIEGVPA